MRQLIVNTFVSLDGVMQAPGGPEEDTSGGFEHGGWSFGYWDASMEAVMGETMGRPFDLVLGRKTYEIFAGYWPHHTDSPAAAPLNDATKHVASRTLTSLEWQNSKLIEGDVAEGIRALKEQDGPELQVHGSANLLQTLQRHGLIDELRLFIFPVVLGHGKRLFEDGARPEGLELTRSQTAPTGVIMATYRPGAEIKKGSFADETPSTA
ncbi:MAG TPA: dihydrofolate reductase family protein [Capillimicrobium sp.]|nr:dihydrofolate reductase family protein [Capillimicrobium sp.]